ncbi:hypothetical protein B0H14DRAFT_2614946 [Mycena olivaceomarginata]|nr:hypothetical protein B0H14DRAFT_2614946 [Mycena olivaceomarginata]
MYHDIVSQPTILRGDRSHAFPIPVEFSDGPEGSEHLIPSKQCLYVQSGLWFFCDHNVMISFHVMKSRHILRMDDLQPGSMIWSALWSQSHGPVYRLEPVETLTVLDDWRQEMIKTKDMTPIFMKMRSRQDVFNGSGAQEATDQLVHTLISPLMPTFYVCDSTAVWARFSRELVEYESTRSYLMTKGDPVGQKNWSCLQSHSRVETDVKDMANKTTLGLYSFRVLVNHIYSVQQTKDIEERPGHQPMICVGNAHRKRPFAEVIAKTGAPNKMRKMNILKENDKNVDVTQGRITRRNMLGASYLRPGCFHDIVGAPGTPTKYCWVLPVYLIGMLGAPSQKLLGDPRKAVGSFQVYYLGGPKPSRKFGWVLLGLLQGSSHDCEEGGSMKIPCRSVVNPAEEGNAFYATAEAGIGVQGGRIKGAVSQAGGNTFYTTVGGTEEGKSAVNQAGGYNVFHSTEGRHRGREGQNAFYGQRARQAYTDSMFIYPALQQKGPAQAPKSQKIPTLAGVTWKTILGASSQTRGFSHRKKDGWSHAEILLPKGAPTGAYLDYNQDGDPLRVVISDIHNYPKWVHKSVCLK